jgi:PKD domain
MARAFRIWQIIVGVAVAASTVVGCTIKDTKAPPLQGPSELSLAFAMSAVPDVLSQDGASQSQITIQARDADGQPARSITFRTDIVVCGVTTDYGSLSARTLVTDSNGRATLTYTAPIYSGVSTDPNCNPQDINIRLTPFGTDFANTLSRQVSIRLYPPGVLLPGGPSPPAAPAPPFTVSASPTAFTNVTFDATGWSAAATTTLVSYDWNFGDGRTGTGKQTFHQFAAGTFVVTLTVTDSNGVSQSAQQSVEVAEGAVPTADFAFSPSAPAVNQTIFFNGSLSTAGIGRKLSRYDWNFGNGATQSGATVSTSYAQTGAFNAVLTVTDDVGQKNSVSKTVTIAGPVGPVAAFTFSPSNPQATVTLATFDAFTSTPGGAAISNYRWNFGDGTIFAGAPAAAAPEGGTYLAPLHTFTAQGNVAVALTVTDTNGKTGAITQTVTVIP